MKSNVLSGRRMVLKEKGSFGLFSNNLWNYSIESVTKLENFALIRKVAIVRKMISYK